MLIQVDVSPQIGYSISVMIVTLSSDAALDNGRIRFYPIVRVTRVTGENLS